MMACGKHGRPQQRCDVHAQLGHLDGLVEVAPPGRPATRHAGRRARAPYPPASQSLGRSPWVSSTTMAGACLARSRSRAATGMPMSSVTIVACASGATSGVTSPSPLRRGCSHAASSRRQWRLAHCMRSPSAIGRRAVAAVVVERLQPGSLRVRAGTQLVGQPDGQRPVDKAARWSAQLDRGVRRSTSAAGSPPPCSRTVASRSRSPASGSIQIVGSAPARHGGHAQVNSAAPQLITSSRSSGSLTGSARVRSARRWITPGATAKIQGWVLCEEGARMAARRIASTVSGATWPGGRR